jgi:hypothetical protein
MSCSNCGGYDKCYCDILRLEDRIYLKDLELFKLKSEFKDLIADRKSVDVEGWIERHLNSTEFRRLGIKV